jgi:hypothetical protein
MIGGRKQRSNKGVSRGPRTGKTRSGTRFRSVKRRSNNKVVRSNNKVVRRSNNKVVRRSNNKVVRRSRKQRSNKGVKRGSYGKRTGKTRSGKKFRGARRN